MAVALFHRHMSFTTRRFHRLSCTSRRNTANCSLSCALLRWLALIPLVAEAVRLNPEGALLPADLMGRSGTELTTSGSWCMSRRHGEPWQQQQRDWGWSNVTSCSASIADLSGSRGKFLLDHAVGVGLGVGLSFRADPAHALLEDVKKEGKCPAYKAVEDFEIDKYMGVWYELAYHDWTQIKVCGCTRFNMTRTNDRVNDAFTTKCPYEAEAGETYLINMREVVDRSNPGSFKEFAFYSKWDNKVVALWKSSEGHYERAIQMQCVEVLGRRAFVGINFLSRKPLVPPGVVAEMFQKARELGLAGIGGSPAEMEMVRHEGCRYPTSSANKESRSWGSAWGVNTLVL